jgi:uncharacterized phiE125 gp8 family phage protein
MPCKHRSQPLPMQIKMKQSVCGPGLFLARGNVYDVAEQRAQDLLRAQLAVAIHSDDPEPASTPSARREKAVRKPQETQKMQRAIFNQTYVLSLDQFNYGDWRSTIPMERRNPLRFSALWESMALRLPMPRLVSVTSITYLDTYGDLQTLDPATYSVDINSQPARIVPSINLTWPTTDYYMPGSVQVTYVSGSYGDGVDVNTCPRSIVAAILLMVGHLYENREATSQLALKTIPLGVDALLNAYRFYGWM